ncbi:MAG TPA: P1 family peptidase [Phycisphaerae bacterium]|nr:P1 family peptidase [Phycisphaerae bacterium]
MTFAATGCSAAWLLTAWAVVVGTAGEGRAADGQARSDRPRAREIGIVIGVLPPGPLNAITDVPGVRVGHRTIVEGETARTGVTAILPHGGNVFQQKVPGAIVVGNGFGKLVGSTQVAELGTLETPVVLTNTLSVFTCADALVTYTLNLEGNEDVGSVNPVVGETNDGWLNDIRARRVRGEDVFAAIAAARSGPVEEGSVGAGTGTRCLGWKGGIGTASRRLPESIGGYTVGVLAQTNFGGILKINGAPVGRELGRYYLQDLADNRADERGSCMLVVATDAPLDARQLERLARRALLGLAAVGSPMTHGSGDYVIAFSTAEAVRVAHRPSGGTEPRTLLRDEDLSPMFQATREVTEEAIVNSLLRATTVTGFGGHTSEAIPVDRVIEICTKYRATSQPVQGDAGSQRARSEREEGALVHLSEEALRIHRSAIVIDGHNDLPWRLRPDADSPSEELDLGQPQPRLQTDIPRLRAGGVGAVFWVAFAPPATARDGTATETALTQLDLICRMVRRYPETFELAFTADDIVRIHGEGRIASLIGVEGGHAIEGSLDTLATFYKRGARYLGLTHSETIDWADSATDEPRHGGLSAFGEKVILEMNRLGMLVDLAHVSPDTMRDVLRVSKAPIIFSHSSAYAVAPHARNVPDDVLRAVARNDGVVMVNFFSGFIHPDGARMTATFFQEERVLKEKYPDPEDFEKAWDEWREAHPIPPGTVGTLVDHIDHVVRVAGIDHVGLGADYEGASTFPAQLEDVSGYPYITQELLDRGYSERDIRKILGGNLLRVFRQVEHVARTWED